MQVLSLAALSLSPVWTNSCADTYLTEDMPPACKYQSVEQSRSKDRMLANRPNTVREPTGVILNLI